MCDFALDKTYGYRAISVAVQCLIRVPIISLNPDVIDRNMDSGERVRRSGDDRIAFKSNNTLNSL